MAHELIMDNPKKVVSILEEVKDSIKRIESTIETTSEIGDMNLATGGVGKLVASVKDLQEPVNAAFKVVGEVQQMVEGHSANFTRLNEGLTL